MPPPRTIQASVVRPKASRSSVSMRTAIVQHPRRSRPATG
jgi:hypothetical protein